MELEKIKKEEVNKDIDLVLHQFFWENFKETGLQKDKISVKEAYELYCTYAIEPMSMEECQ
jgi:hypothetical protein